MRSHRVPGGPRSLSFEPGDIICAVGDFKQFVVYDEGRIHLNLAENERETWAWATTRAGSGISRLRPAPHTDKPIVVIRAPGA